MEGPQKPTLFPNHVCYINIEFQLKRHSSPSGLPSNTTAYRLQRVSAKTHISRSQRSSASLQNVQVHDLNRSPGRDRVDGRQHPGPQGADRRGQPHRGARAARAREVRLHVRSQGTVAAAVARRSRSVRALGNHQPAQEVPGHRDQRDLQQAQIHEPEEIPEGRPGGRPRHRPRSRGRRGRGRSGVAHLGHLRRGAVPQVLPRRRRQRRRDVRFQPRLHRQLRPGRVQQIRNATAQGMMRSCVRPRRRSSVRRRSSFNIPTLARCRFLFIV